MTWCFVGNVTDVRGSDNPPSCLVRNQLTGRAAWYRVSARVTPPIRVGEWVQVVGGGDPDAFSAADFEPQVVERADPPVPSSPIPVAAEMHRPESAQRPASAVTPAADDPSVWDRASTMQIERIPAGIRISLIDPSGNMWSAVRLDAGGWATGDGPAPGMLTAEAYAALDAVIAVYRLVTMHL